MAREPMSETRNPPPQGYEFHPSVPGLMRRRPTAEAAYREQLGLLADDKRGALSPLGGEAKGWPEPKGRRS